MTYQYDPIIMIEKNSLDTALLPPVSTTNVEQGEESKPEAVENKPTVPGEVTSTGNQQQTPATVT